MSCWNQSGVLIAAALMTAAGAARAQTELYFTEYQYQNPKIKAIGVDGSNLRELFTIPASEWLPLGLGVDAANGRLYWTDSVYPDPNVWSAGINGTPAPAIVTTATGPTGRGAAFDSSGRVYFTVHNTIQRVDANGANPQVLYTSFIDSTFGAPTVDATNGHVYFADNGEIKRMNLDGTNVKTVVRGTSQPRSVQVDVAAGHVYWIDADTHTDFVGRANLDGTGFTIVSDLSPSVVQSPGLIDLLLDKAGGKIYFADELATHIYRSNLDGSNRETFYTSPAGLTPSGLALSTGAIVQPVADCNSNGVPDAQDIALGTSLDCNDNGVPDSCEADACPNRVFLLDTGSDAVNTFGRALGWPSSWEQLQPFDVPPGGWSIGEIGVDGATTNYHDGTGFSLAVFADNGTGEAPDETVAPLAEVTGVNFYFDFNNSVWVYRDLNVTLPEGRHWIRVRAVDGVVYAGSVNMGFTGLNSKFRGSSGNLQSFNRSLAVRLVQAPECAADFNNSGSVTVQDIFDFLAAYFANDPDADFNNSGGVTVQDIFDFLAAYFVGC